VIDGAPAARFVAELRLLIENAEVLRALGAGTSTGHPKGPAE